MQNFLITLFLTCLCFNNEITQPSQQSIGYGGSEYQHTSVKIYDFAKKADGYWMYVPANPVPKTANLIVFMHGYGAYNPMIYGKWIRHLVQKGNVVVFPRYQRNLITPRPNKFAKNAAKGIKAALEELKKEEYPTINTDQFAFFGHSYGSVIASDLIANYEAFEIPKPGSVLMCSPGTGPLKGGRLDSYENIPEDINMIILHSENDMVVGDEFGNLVYKTAINTPNRKMFYQFTDNHGSPAISAGHNECYSLDTYFDTGVRNITAKRALRISKLDVLDYNGYWKLGDALLDCTRNNLAFDEVFEGKNGRYWLGDWSDNEPIRPLKIVNP